MLIGPPCALVNWGSSSWKGPLAVWGAIYAMYGVYIRNCFPPKSCAALPEGSSSWKIHLAKGLFSIVQLYGKFDLQTNRVDDCPCKPTQRWWVLQGIYFNSNGIANVLSLYRLTPKYHIKYDSKDCEGGSFKSLQIKVLLNLSLLKRGFMCSTFRQTLTLLSFLSTTVSFMILRLRPKTITLQLMSTSMWTLFVPTTKALPIAGQECWMRSPPYGHGCHSFWARLPGDGMSQSFKRLPCN